MQPTAFSALSTYNSAVLVIDVQEKLTATLGKKVRASLQAHLQLVAKSTEILDVPLLLTEQYPKGLGQTVGCLSQYKTENNTSEKLEFSCTSNPDFQNKLLLTGRPNVIVAGMETHICVLQTVAGLLERGYQPWVLSDATASRTKLNWKHGLRLAQSMGAWVVPTETILFQLMQRSGTEHFKAISQLLKAMDADND